MLFSLFRKKQSVNPAMNYLVAGLGNIGAEYAHTRHNAGFMILDAWAQASNILFENERYAAHATVSYRGRKIHLIKPSTYMNLSGNAVRYWMQKLGIGPSNLIVISDDLNLPFGSVRMRLKGSDGGHNGLKNICELIGTSDYARIRIGIGNDFHPGEQIDFVLGEMTESQEETIVSLAPRIIEGIQLFCTAGGIKSVETVNSKPQKQGNE